MSQQHQQMDSFEHMTNFSSTDDVVKNQRLISPAEFESWQQHYMFDALKGLRYGQSFCNRFNITDNILYYTQFSTIPECDRYIRKNYVTGS